MPDTVTKAEATLIAQDAAEKALHKHAEHLPNAMKPVMYEVAETVARRGTADMHKLFSTIFGADVTNQEHLRDLHKDLFHLRDQRVTYEARRRVVRQEFYRAMFKYAGVVLFSAITAVAILLGIRLPPPPGG